MGRQCSVCTRKWSKWLAAQPVVWLDKDGVGYCAFHAPRDEKWKVLGGDERYSEEEFNGLIFAFIDDAIEFSRRERLDVECLLTETVFPWDISFARYGSSNALPHLILSKAVFHGDADFEKVVFSGNATFTLARFEKEAKFADIRCSGKFDFVGARVSGEAKFFRAIFNGEASFSTSRFENIVSFTSAKFDTEVEFYSTGFLGSSSFMGARFDDIARFDYARFGENANFLEIKTSDEFGIKLWSCSAGSIGNLYFSAGEANCFSFYNCEMPDVLGLERYKSYEIRELECQHLYRVMKQVAAAAHDQVLVSRWHYREKLMALRIVLGFDQEDAWSWSTIKWLISERWRERVDTVKYIVPYGFVVAKRAVLSLLFWYWLTSGFGERAVRAGVCLGVLVGLSFLLNSIPQPWDWSTLPGSAAANATMATIPFAKDIPGEGWVKVGRGFWQFLIAVQFTLFALAVRNRFRR